MTDPIADLLTRMRNAFRAKHRFLDVDHSNMKEAIIRILKDKGLVAHYLVKEERRLKTMRVFLKYDARRESVLHGLRRVSKPSLRKYVSFSAIPRVFGGMGISILSTPKGMLEGSEAREKKVGGELICLAW